MATNTQLAKDFVENVVVNNLYSIITHINYPSVEAFDIIKIFINAHNELSTNEDDTKICDIMDNKSLIEVMSRYENFNARIISELYGLLDNSKENKPFFLYNNNLLVNEIELVTVSSIGEIKSTIIDNLKNIAWAALKTPENPIFTPIYKMIYQSIFNE